MKTGQGGGKINRPDDMKNSQNAPLSSVGFLKNPLGLRSCASFSKPETVTAKKYDDLRLRNHSFESRAEAALFRNKAEHE